MSTPVTGPSWEGATATVRSPRPAGGSQLDRLAAEARQAAKVRAYQTHPDVVALRVEQIRAQVDRLCWAGIVLGLAFTMTNVQRFAAGSAVAWSLPWLTAWLLDPMVSLVLLAILRAEQVTARYRVATGAWVRRAKWFTLAATYVMNTWESWVAGSVSGVVLHSVPPLVVFTAAEAVTDLRDKLTAAVAAAFAEAEDQAPTTAGVNAEPVHDTSPSKPVDRVVKRGRRGAPVNGRKLFADYLADARAAWSPDVEVTPAWVRQVTTCSRGLSSRLAAALAAELVEGVRP
ncbi:hypothetical protein [Alloactinosynnema sp. L-07]|uniref:hypothetical protein n=1 Tax=Alloactinosynnema sp. L-07 TaxID=1653480 RepID=UPI000AB8FC8E|nr:hypothetical protein [Alloactinosynnema sp. L-07]